MSINRKILRIALPSIVSNITVPLLGLVDVAITGHVGGAVYMGAIAVGSMIFNLLYWLFGFVRMGTSGLTAQALGRRDLRGVAQMLRVSLATGLAIAACFVVLQWPLRWVALALMHPTADVLPLAATYFNIVVWGAPAVMASYSLSGWFVGMQNTRIPMLVSIVQNVVNIVASVVLVFGMGLRIEGVALGTLMAQYVGCLLALALLWRYYGRLFKGASLILHPSSLISHLSSRTQFSFFTVNRDIFLRTLCLVAVNLFFTSAGARQGAQVLSANTLLMQLYILYSYVMDGFAYAGEALGGRHYGARDWRSLSAVVRRLFVWGAGLAVAATAVYALGGQTLLRLLTTDEAVVQTATRYLPWALAVPAVGTAAFLWDGVFIGITAARAMLVSSVVSTAAFFALFLMLQGRAGNHALWAAFVAYLLLRGAVQTVQYLRLRGSRL